PVVVVTDAVHPDLDGGCVRGACDVLGRGDRLRHRALPSSAAPLPAAPPPAPPRHAVGATGPTSGCPSTGGTASSSARSAYRSDTCTVVPPARSRQGSAGRRRTRARRGRLEGRHKCPGGNPVGSRRVQPTVA